MRSGLASSLAGTTQQGSALEQVQPATNRRRRIVTITTIAAGLTLAVVAGLRRRAANRD